MRRPSGRIDLHPRPGWDRSVALHTHRSTRTAARAGAARRSSLGSARRRSWCTVHRRPRADATPCARARAGRRGGAAGAGLDRAPAGGARRPGRRGLRADRGRGAARRLHRGQPGRQQRRDALPVSGLAAVPDGAPGRGVDWRQVGPIGEVPRGRPTAGAVGIASLAEWRDHRSIGTKPGARLHAGVRHCGAAARKASPGGRSAGRSNGDVIAVFTHREPSGPTADDHHHTGRSLAGRPGEPLPSSAGDLCSSISGPATPRWRRRQVAAALGRGRR
jgi:hypothetical protein